MFATEACFFFASWHLLSGSLFKRPREEEIVVMDLTDRFSIFLQFKHRLGNQLAGSHIFILFIYLFFYFKAKMYFMICLMLLSVDRYLDGFSVFEVGSDGLIHCHRLHKVCIKEWERHRGNRYIMLWGKPLDFEKL